MKTMKVILLSLLLFGAVSCKDQEDGQYIPGVNGPELNVQDGKILLELELENIVLDTELTLSVPELPHSSVWIGEKVYDDGSLGGTAIKVTFDLKDVESDEFQVVPAQYLPDGREFPFMVDGTLPALAFHVPKAKKMTFYASEQLFGFFLPLKVPKDFVDEVNYRIRINGVNYGLVALVHPNDLDEGSGIVVLLTLDEIRSNPDAKKLLKFSKRFKNTVF